MHTSTLLALLLAVALCAGAAHAKKHHSAVSNTTHIDPNEVMPSPCPAINRPITYGQYQEKLDSLANCKYDRAKIAGIFLEYFDYEGTGKLSPAGCQMLMDTFVPHALQGLVNKLTKGGCSGVFAHCDCDGDGIIEPAEMAPNLPFCLDTCEKLETFADVFGSHLPDGVLEQAKNPGYHK